MCESFNLDRTTMKSLVSSESENKNSPYKTMSHGWNINFASSTDETAENKQDETKKMDETYELSEPETPTLRRILKGKRNTKKNKLNIKYERKPLRVHFKDSMLGTSLSSIVTKTRSEKNISTSSTNIFHKRTNCADNKTSSTTVADSKFLASKEVPNFAEIHKRMFGKLESVVDAKKRLEDRHTTLTAVKLNKSTNLSIQSKEKDQILDKPKKSAYNRIGFKIKKEEAIGCILRKNNIQNTRSKVQQQSRVILKGVRTNRRFELQMNLIL